MTKIKTDTHRMLVVQSLIIISNHQSQFICGNAQNKCLSFSANTTYGSYNHRHTSGTLGVIATSTQGKYLDYIEKNYGSESWTSTNRLTFTSIDKVAADHSYIIPLNGKTASNSNIQPSICTYFFVRIK